MVPASLVFKAKNISMTSKEQELAISAGAISPTLSTFIHSPLKFWLPKMLTFKGQYPKN